MRRFNNLIHNRVNRCRSSCLNKMLDRQFHKISKDYMDSDKDCKGLNDSIHMLYTRTFDLEMKDTLIDPLESRRSTQKMHDEIEKILEKHRQLFEILDE